MSVTERVIKHHPTYIYVFPVEYVLGPCIGIKIESRLWLFHASADSLDYPEIIKSGNWQQKEWDESADYLLNENKFQGELAVFGVDRIEIRGSSIGAIIARDREGRMLYGMDIFNLSNMDGSAMVHPELNLIDNTVPLT